MTWLCALTLLCLTGLANSLQTRAQSPATKSRVDAASIDQTTLALLERALANSGGEAWNMVGAATTDVTVPLHDGSQSQIHWADDWSGSSVISRREVIGGSHGRNLMITSARIQSHWRDNGTSTQYPGDSDPVILAVGYPAAALFRSLQDQRCKFFTSQHPQGRWPAPPLTKDENEIPVYQQCLDPGAPDGYVDIAWIIDKSTATLRGAWLPIRGMVTNRVLYEQVQFVSFQTVGDLLVPRRVLITRPTGRTDTLVLDSPHFSPQLPPSTFDPKK
jgi:hypothetical protein